MDENEVFENYHFVMVKRLLMIMCIWPYQKRTTKLYGRTFIIVAIHTMMIPQMIKFYTEWYKEDRDVQIVAENFTGFLYFQGVLSKLYMSIYKEKKLQRLYEDMMRDYKEIQAPEERAAMDEFWNFARILCIIYASYMFIALLFFVFTPQVIPAIFDVIWPMNESRPKTICYYAEYFIDQDKYLCPLILHTLLCVGFTLLIISSVDTSYMTVAYHVLGLFNLLTWRLKQLCELGNNNVNREDERLHDFVVETIKIHKKTINFAEVVRFTYNEAHFFTFGLTVAGLAIGTIDVMANLTNPSVILRIGFVWIGLVAYLFFVNWPGQSFIDCSSDLFGSIYSCNWYQLPLKTQFLMRFMMMRCLIPCQLTAGPLLQMNFANCGVMIKFYEEWYEEDPDIQILSENFSGFLYFHVLLFKFYINIYNEKKLQSLYEEITRDYVEIQEPGEKAAMNELRDFARLLTIVFSSYMLTALFFFVFTPSVLPIVLDAISPLNESRHKMICYYAEYFIDQDDYLIPLICHTFVVVAITLFLFVSTDNAYTMVTYHVLALFNLLTYRLKLVCEWANYNVDRDDERLHNFVIDTIKIHSKTLNFAEQVRATYDLNYFIVFSMSLIGLSIGTIEVVMNLTHPEILLRIGFVFVGLIAYLFYVNWPGQRFLNSSNDFLESIYSCNWYKLPVKTQFLIKFMMMRCFAPCQLTAGPLFQLNFAYCGAILKTAMSYFTAVYSVG